jgi:hypothetical protein
MPFAPLPATAQNPSRSTLHTQEQKGQTLFALKHDPHVIA